MGNRYISKTCSKFFQFILICIHFYSLFDQEQTFLYVVEGKLLYATRTRIDNPYINEYFKKNGFL